MPLPGWVSISLKEALVARVDDFIDQNVEGYSNRAEVVAAAIRQFLDAHAAKQAARRAAGAPAKATRRRRSGP